jgi:hypothetical protein
MQLAGYGSITQIAPPLHRRPQVPNWVLRVLAWRELVQRVLAWRVLAWRVLAWRVLAWRVLAWRVLAWRVLAWRVRAWRVPWLHGSGRVYKSLDRSWDL